MRIAPALDRSLPLVLGASAFAGMLWYMPHGVGVSPDSTIYIEAARNLLNGEGLTAAGRPVAHYPPGYSWLLAAAALLTGLDVPQGAAYVHAALFGLSTCLIGVAVRESGARSPLVPVCAALLFLTSPGVLQVHSNAWSESPFITFLLAHGIFLARYLDRQRRADFVMAVLSAALALMTRYVGIVIVPTFALALLLLSRHPPRIRIGLAVLGSTMIAFPTCVWMLRNLMIAATTTNRSFALHPAGLDRAWQFLHTVVHIAQPFEIAFRAVPVAAGVAILLAATSYFAWRAAFPRFGDHAEARETRRTLPLIFTAFGIAYLVFLWLSISLIDADTPADNRILQPALIALGVAAFTMFTTGLQHSLSRPTCLLLIGGMCIIVTFNAAHAAQKRHQASEYGIRGYTSREWQSSKVMAAVKNLEAPIRIYSNGPHVIHFLSARTAFTIPLRASPTSLAANPRYTEQVSAMIDECRAGTAVIVQLNRHYLQWHLPSGDELQREFNLPIREKFSDGTVYCLRRT